MGDTDGPEAPDIQALAALKKSYILNYTVDANGCWLHNNAPNNEGYVTLVFWIGRKNKAFKAHRLSYVLFKGEIPQGLNILHTCDVRKCINPYHLYAGTFTDNVNDMYERGRNLLALTEDDISFIIVLHEAGYSQTEIARMVGVAQTSVSNHLRGVK